jgi:O-antigen ligase
MLNQLSARYNLWKYAPLAALIVAGGIFWIAYDSGSYGPTARGSVGLVLLWAATLGLSLSVWPNAPLPRPAILAGGLLAAFAAWTGLSVFWAASPEGAFDEFGRAVIYLAAFVLAVVVPARADLNRWLAGIAIGLTAVGLLALISRLFPTSFSAPRELAQIFPTAERRLSYPVDYWNGLATLMAFAIPLLLFFAVNATRLVLRAVALAPVPALVATIYLTSSRGGSIAAALAVVIFLALTGRRWAALGAVVVAGAASAAAVAVFVASPELVNHPHESAEAVGQGHTAAVVVLVTAVLTGLAYAILVRLLPSPRPLGRVGVAVVVGILVAAIAVGIVAVRPVHRFDEFKKPPPASFGGASVQQHLFAGTGNGRWQLWESAADEFESRPLTGRGAGSYEAWWAQHGTLPYFVRDAHSLYLETLGELGIVGLVLLVAFLVTVVVAGATRLASRSPAERSAVAALLGAFAAFLFEAAVDWIWELTAAAVVAALVAGLLAGPATQALSDEESEPPLVGGKRRSRTRFVRLGAVTILIALIVAVSIPLLTAMKIRQSQDAVEAGKLSQALKDAQGARSLQPWAASPYLQLALVYEQAGQVDAALGGIHKALSRDESDWRLWLVATRLETKAGDIAAARASLAKARELNPRSPLFATS